MVNKRTELERHVSALRQCARCPDVFGPPVLGAVPAARVYLMGQAPGPKEQAQGKPFVWTAGTTLFKWFASIGVDEETFRKRVYMGAVIRCFPGKLAGKQGDRRPSRKEMELCRAHRETEFALLAPELVLLVGKMAIDLYLPGKTLNDLVGRTVAISEGARQFDALPLPHPSGLNRWIQKDPGKSLLNQALRELAGHPAWRATFPDTTSGGA